MSAAAEPVKEEQVEEAPTHVMRVVDETDPEMLSAIMEGVAYPRNSSNYYTKMADPNSAVSSYERQVPRAADFDNLLMKTLPVLVYIRMFNQGNFIDIAAEAAAGGRASGPLAAIAGAVASIARNASFRIARCKIMSPLLGVQDVQERSAAILEAKNAILRGPNVPPGINPDDLSWDAISYKIPYSAMEMFCHKNPVALKQLDANQLALIDQLQQTCTTAIDEKCAEFRARSGTRPDEFVTDKSIYIESQLAGRADGDRAMRVARIGRATLLNYVDNMQSVFLSGNLPSAIQPSKIYASHDVVSMIELRGSIQKLAETQVTQVFGTIKNASIASRVYKMGANLEAEGWTQNQGASVGLKRTIDTFQRRLYNTLSDEYEQPMKRLENQINGSSNTLAQQLEHRTGDAVVTQNEEQKEIAKQQLSILLACLRTRANATQQSDWELITDDDLDHFEVVKYLSQQDSDIGAGGEDITRIASTLQETLQSGHNVTKYNHIGLDQQLVELINYTIQGRAKTVVRQIPMFDEDLKKGEQVFNILMRCVMMAVAQEVRIGEELKDRMVQRKANRQAGGTLV